jgi:regulator of sirC expression with transglutaminase-like and TPR domain
MIGIASGHGDATLLQSGGHMHYTVRTRVPHRRPDLAIFRHVVCRPEAQLDLAQAALLIAEPEYPNLDIAGYMEILDHIGDEAMRRLEGRGNDPLARVEHILKMLYGELGFSGNDVDYYDPRNSFLNEVLDRRTGIPITLAVVVIEVCRRAGIDARGVSFPGHFLVRIVDAFVDPFTGKVLNREDLRTLHGRVAGEPSDPDPRLLEPATNGQILMRMLANLRGVYSARGDRERLYAVLERMDALSPSEDVRRELELLHRTGPSNSGALN